MEGKGRERESVVKGGDGEDRGRKEEEEETGIGMRVASLEHMGRVKCDGGKRKKSVGRSREGRERQGAEKTDLFSLELKKEEERIKEEEEDGQVS